MNRLEIDQLKASVNIVDVINQHVHLEKVKAGEYKGQCCFHEDTKPSMTVSENKQIFHCFVCNTGGDVLAFFMQQPNYSFKDAVNAIKGDIDSSVQQQKKPVKKKKTNPIKSPDSYPAEFPEVNHYKMGAPADHWNYTDHLGHYMTIIRRYNFKEGKSYMPLSWLDVGNGPQWVDLQIPVDRPVYNLQLIHRFPDAEIIVVEGEKCADYGQKLVDPKEFIFTTWIGGSNAIYKTNFRPLEGRKVLKWPDNDDAGKKAVTLLPIDGEYIHVPEDKPKKWDIADSGFDSVQLLEFIKNNTSTEPMIFSEPTMKNKIVAEVKNHKTKAPEQEPATEDAKLSVTKQYFEFLGTKITNNQPHFYFYIRRIKNVIKFASTELTRKVNIEQLAPADIWENMFSDRKSYNKDWVASFLVEESMKKIINVDTERSVGCWLDDGRIIFFDGQTIYHKEKRYSAFDFPTENVYMPSSEIVKFSAKNPMNDSDGKKTWNFIKELEFKNIDQNRLLAGWIVLSPFASLLRWRPHIWLIGESGKGKSWITDHVIMRMGGGISILASGGTSAAGLRNYISSTGRSVVIDEMDGQNKKMRDMIGEIIELARMSSYREGGAIFKANTTGGGFSFDVKSAFCFTSVNEQLEMQSDKNRFSVLSLDKQIDQKRFEKFEKAYDEFMTEETVSSLISRTFYNLENILSNAELIKTYLRSKFSARESDQISFLLAGYIGLLKTGEISKAQAKKMADDYENKTSDELEKREMNDNLELLNLILGYQYRISAGYFYEFSLGRLISIAARLDELPNEENGPMTDKICDESLRNFGIKVNREKQTFIIMNSSRKIIDNILEKSPFNSNYHKQLRRLEDAVETDTTYFTQGVYGRGTEIPFKYLNMGISEADIEKPAEPEKENLEDSVDPEFKFEGQNIDKDDLPF
jgi:hypothetical protein